MYRGYAFLLLKTSHEMLLSREGVTQGDPLSMMFYFVATLPRSEPGRGMIAGFRARMLIILFVLAH